MVIIASLAIVACIALLIWMGINTLFLIPELVVAIVRKEKAQIVMHAIQLSLTIIAIVLVLTFLIVGGEK